MRTSSGVASARIAAASSAPTASTPALASAPATSAGAGGCHPPSIARASGGSSCFFRLTSSPTGTRREASGHSRAPGPHARCPSASSPSRPSASRASPPYEACARLASARPQRTRCERSADTSTMKANKSCKPSSDFKRIISRARPGARASRPSGAVVSTTLTPTEPAHALLLPPPSSKTLRSPTSSACDESASSALLLARNW
mmetsp:Transcript_17470/g.54311  ORF Transcript_17470/g.54311 Transcript_17470/m.54311 type:complete len:203 (-) Transcript_17470:127-735(-)